MQFPKLSETNPLLHSHVLMFDTIGVFKLALDLQEVQEVDRELAQVLQVEWHPVETQFPVLCSNPNPERQVHTAEFPLMMRSAFNLQDWQLVLVLPKQVLQEISHATQRPETESKYLLVGHKQVRLLRDIRLFLQVRQLEAPVPSQVPQVAWQGRQLTESW
jgi:hypothetical protein